MGKRETEGQRRSPRGWLAFLLTVCPERFTLRITPSVALRSGVHSVPGCHLNQSRGGFENGPPAKGGRSDLSGPYN